MKGFGGRGMMKVPHAKSRLMGFREVVKELCKKYDINLHSLIVDPGITAHIDSVLAGESEALEEIARLNEVIEELKK